MRANTILISIGRIGIGTVGCGEDSLTASSSADLLSSCAGVFNCEGIDGDDYNTELRQEDGTCWVGGLKILADGEVADEEGRVGADVFWRGNAAQFEVCQDDICIRCAREGASQNEQIGSSSSSSSGSSRGRCSGTASSCYSRYPGGCYVQRGCYLGYKYKWDGSSEPVCKGVPIGCYDLRTESGCSGQIGCHWVD